MAPIEVDHDGFWGKPTATIDWCEANYEISSYIAEFWNTVSNVGIIGPPALGMYYSIKDKLEWRFVFCHMSLCVVGIGSWLFHSTLLYNMQLMDELPMVWGSGFLIYCMYEMLSPKNHINTKLVVFLTLYCLVVTVVYIIVKYPLFHQVAYALMVFSLFVPALRLIRTYPGSLFLLGCSLYGFAFFVWNLDNIFCSQLKVIRASVGPVFAPPTQLHGWWHVFAGLGSYHHLIFSMETRFLVLKEKYEMEKLLGFLPFPRIKKDFVR